MIDASSICQVFARYIDAQSLLGICPVFARQNAHFCLACAKLMLGTSYEPSLKMLGSYPDYQSLLGRCPVFSLHIHQFLACVNQQPGIADLQYHKVPKFSDTRKHCCNHPKIQTKRPTLELFCRKHAN